MRTIYRLDGKMIDVDVIHIPPLVIGDTSYPVLRPFMDQLGIVSAEVDDFPDLQLFDCTEDEAGNLTITPKDPAVIAARQLAEANRLAQVQLEAKQEAYRTESDPIFFQEQRKEIPEGSWLAKIAEIKARYPK